MSRAPTSEIENVMWRGVTFVFKSLLDLKIAPSLSIHRSIGIHFNDLFQDLIETSIFLKAIMCKASFSFPSIQLFLIIGFHPSICPLQEGNQNTHPWMNTNEKSRRNRNCNRVVIISTEKRKLFHDKYENSLAFVLSTISSVTIDQLQLLLACTVLLLTCLFLVLGGVDAPVGAIWFLTWNQFFILTHFASSSSKLSLEQLM